MRGEEEGIGEAVIARCRTSVELLAPHADTPGLDIRTARQQADLMKPANEGRIIPALFRSLHSIRRQGRTSLRARRSGRRGAPSPLEFFES